MIKRLLSVYKIIYVLCVFTLLGCTNTSQNNHASSLDSLSFLITQDSENISYLKKRADIYYNNNEFDLAKNDIETAYHLFKNDVDILFQRGEIYYALNQTRISKESWERCLKINPNHIDCRQKLTELLCIVRSPRCSAMIDTLSLLSNGLISIPLIIALKDLKEYDSVLFFLNKLKNMQPDNKEILSLLSVIHSDTSFQNKHFDISLAETYFNKIIDLYPNDIQVYYNFGKHKQNILEYETALKLYHQNLKLDPSNKQTYYNMGFCAMQLKHYEQAINYFTESIALDNSFLLAYHARAYLYELIDDLDKAKSDWKTCLMLSPSYIPALQGLSK
tara:strand:- start:1523 stop:2521 length:999 start_codon:yes stop_codon:yes gene_type:complete